MFQIQPVIDRWYGCVMPCRILEKYDEIDEYEDNHPEVPPALWEFVDHTARVFRMWANDDADIVLQRGGQFVMIQDEYYIAAYPDVEAWHHAVLECLKSESSYYLVFHQY
jgi:hypothetical protein